MPNHPLAERLNIFVDEFGNSDCSYQGPKSFGVAFTLHENHLPITGPLDILNTKLAAAGHTGMIHLADLIAQRGVYAGFDLKTRQAIFQAIYHFTMHVPINVHSIVVNTAMLDNSDQLAERLQEQIMSFFEMISPTLEQHRQVVIYYDKGQKILAKIFNSIAQQYPNVEIRSKFDHAKKRLFQVSDMLTKLDKMQLDLDNGYAWTKGESYFFTKSAFREIRRQINCKRLPSKPNQRPPYKM